LVLVAGLLGAGEAARACSVPVFRYALERWPADRFSAVVFASGKLSEAQDEVLAGIYRAADSPGALVNMAVERVDVKEGVGEKYQALWEEQGRDAKLPRLVIRYPAAEQGVLWAGDLESADLKTLLDSPARRELGSRLLRGDVVFVLLESGSSARDERAAKLIEEQIPILEKTVKVSQVVADDPLVVGPAILSALPLKLKLSMLRVSRDDPKEKLFVRMLLKSQETELAEDMPVVFPVFGRGRVLCAFPGMQIKADNLEDAAKFLAGPCSCQVKELNPGVDLLMGADWDSLVEGREALATTNARVEIPEPKLRMPTTRAAKQAPITDGETIISGNATVKGVDKSQLALRVGILVMIFMVVLLGVLLVMRRMQGLPWI
jgi:hypothetical protein